MWRLTGHSILLNEVTVGPAVKAEPGVHVSLYCMPGVAVSPPRPLFFSSSGRDLQSVRLPHNNSIFSKLLHIWYISESAPDASTCQTKP